jgi:hypothetical protein
MSTPVGRCLSRLADSTFDQQGAGRRTAREPVIDLSQLRPRRQEKLLQRVYRRQSVAEHRHPAVPVQRQDASCESQSMAHQQ